MGSLAPLGVEIGHAENGQVAVDKATSSRWDLIFLDVVMPVMDGPTALREIRARGITTPVVLVTSVSTTAVVATAVKLGGVCYLNKPFTQHQIRAVAVKLLKVDTAPKDPPSFVLSQQVDPDLHQRLRQALPAHVAIDLAESLAQSLDLAESGLRDLVLIDRRGVGGDLVHVVNELRGVLPAAGIFAIADDGAAHPPWLPDAGLDGVLPRTFDAAMVQDFLYLNFLRPLVSVEGDVARAAGFVGPPAHLPAYLASLGRALVDRCARLDAITKLQIDLRCMPADVDAVLAILGTVNGKLREGGAVPAFQLSTAMRETAAGRLTPFVIV
jgi:CheY-like chemotaxis protein